MQDKKYGNKTRIKWDKEKHYRYLPTQSYFVYQKCNVLPFIQTTK